MIILQLRYQRYQRDLIDVGRWKDLFQEFTATDLDAGKLEAQRVWDELSRGATRLRYKSLTQVINWQPREHAR